MKYLRIINFMIISILAISCQEDDLGLEDISVPTNLIINTDVSTDGSGIVNFNVSADNAFTYQFNFEDGSKETSLDGTLEKRFTRIGLNQYLVTVVAYGKGGVSSSRSIEVEVESTFDDPETKQFLTGGSSKTWYIASAVSGHLGVGPRLDPGSGEVRADDEYFSAAAEFGPECFYDDEMIFSLTNEGDIKYVYNDFGETFVQWSLTPQFGGNGNQFQDECLAVGASDDIAVSLIPASSGISEDLSTGTSIQLSGNAFIAYYVDNSEYEVLEINENFMYLRVIQGNDPALAWYIKLTTNADGSVVSDRSEEPGFQSQFTTEVWSDEFEGDALDTDKWNYAIGNGENGWGNGEAQYYTDAEDNVKVQDGHLIITAKREAESGFDFTSARITTKDKYEFTYGRVEVRAKLAEGQGTWPAIWMLGEGWPEESWPGVGEMDIMEFVGNDPDRISSAIHYTGNSGGDAIVGEVTGVDDVTSEFHVYEVEWTEDKITFFMDGVNHLEFDNSDATPFNDDFYLLLNVAMGGSLGGTIADDFQESSMEVDYIRVFQ
ncbi:family 16 glycosylhydrolase [Gramella sp. KN1008]|uniref:family 16 glycosylhydrolase n=1 Tax=Gramella sp. KN1008 TaxID=2529298 RepID=UPI0010399DED|nr:family 16 glycosylhydrolase [Gramella sp. KN1008]TBW27109.1 glycosyl hydrolase family protein [Gramella sp. KN1008]